VPLNGIPVTFQAPTNGASGSFASGGITAVVTTTANGIASAPAFIANAIAGSYSVTATVSGVNASASFVLTNTAPCDPLIVTSTTDNGHETICGKLSNALMVAKSGQTISFNLITGTTVMG
jgi:hypothetical protein